MLGLSLNAFTKGSGAPKAPNLEDIVTLPSLGDIFSITQWDRQIHAGDSFEQKVREVFGTLGEGIDDAYGFHLNENGVWEADGKYPISFRQFIEDMNGIPFPQFHSRVIFIS